MDFRGEQAGLVACRRFAMYTKLYGLTCYKSIKLLFEGHSVPYPAEPSNSDLYNISII